MELSLQRGIYQLLSGEMEKEGKWQVKGSGSTGCLLNQNMQDEQQFIEWDSGVGLQQVQLAGMFACGLHTNGDLYLWGSCSNRLIVKPQLIMRNVHRFSCGWDHALIESDHQLYGMGCNSNLQLGITTESRYLFEPILVWKQPIQHFAAGFRQSYLISQDTLYGCGESKKFELAVKSSKPSEWRELTTHLSQKLGTPVETMKCGKRFIALLTKSHQLFVLGNNQLNCFALPEITHCVEPTLIFSQIDKFSCGWAHIVLLTQGREVLSFGRNNLGQLGHGENTDKVQFQLQNDEFITQIICGSEFSFAISNRGQVMVWGWNEHFNLTPSPQKILPLPVPLRNFIGKSVKIITGPAITLAKIGPNQ